MSQLVCCTSQHGVGCTFLEWSINYLSGRTQYLSATEGLIDLIDDPMQSTNAHGHRKNHPIGKDQTQEYVRILSNSDFATFYAKPLHISQAMQRLSKRVEGLNADTVKELNSYVDEDYSSMLHDLTDAKIIYVALDPSLSLYLLKSRADTEILLHSNQYTANHERIKRDRDIAFFRESINTWESLGATNTWDLRERLALSSRPFKSARTINLDFPHLWIDSRELWFCGESTIRTVMRWLNISIDETRYTHWLTVYQRFSQMQSNNLSFHFKCNHIVECIVNDWSYPIDLTFDQEVVVQHCLMYKHNLTLKTWQLEKFPDNTRALHALLEPNFHPLKYEI